MSGRTPEQAAFLAGFLASGEGWNGEWPFEGEPEDYVWDCIRGRYEKWAKTGGAS